MEKSQHDFDVQDKILTQIESLQSCTLVVRKPLAVIGQLPQVAAVVTKHSLELQKYIVVTCKLQKQEKTLLSSCRSTP